MAKPFELTVEQLTALMKLLADAAAMYCELSQADDIVIVGDDDDDNEEEEGFRLRPEDNEDGETNA